MTKHFTRDYSSYEADGSCGRGISIEYFAPYGTLDACGVATKVSPPMVPSPKSPDSSLERLAPYGSFQYTNLTAKIGPIKAPERRLSIYGHSVGEGAELAAKAQTPAKVIGTAISDRRVMRLNAGKC